MGLKDRHDARLFTHFIKLNADGTVAAIVERADQAPPPVDGAGSVYVDITEFRKSKSIVNLYALKLDAMAVQVAMAEPDMDRRSSLLTEFNRAFGAAIPDAVADAVFGARDGGS